MFIRRMLFVILLVSSPLQAMNWDLDKDIKHEEQSFTASLRAQKPKKAVSTIWLDAVTKLKTIYEKLPQHVWHENSKKALIKKGEEHAAKLDAALKCCAIITPDQEPCKEHQINIIQCFLDNILFILSMECNDEKAPKIKDLPIPVRMLALDGPTLLRTKLKYYNCNKVPLLETLNECIKLYDQTVKKLYKI